MTVNIFFSVAESECECWKIRTHEKSEKPSRAFKFSVPLTTNVPNAFFENFVNSPCVTLSEATAAVPFGLPETHAHYQCVSSNESSTSLGRSKFLKGLHLFSRKRVLNRNLVHSRRCWLVSWITLCSGILALLFMIDKKTSDREVYQLHVQRPWQTSKFPCAASQLQLLVKIWRTVYTKRAPQK